MKPNNRVRIDGQLAQETVELLSTAPLLARAAVDTGPVEAGGRHYVLFEGPQVTKLAAYLAAVQVAGIPLPVSVSGSLRHEGRFSMLVDLDEVSYGVGRLVRLQAEELIKRRVPLYPERGPQYPLSVGYHSCVYMSGALDLRSFRLREEAGKGQAAIAKFNTGDEGVSGCHDLLLAGRQAEDALAACRELEAGRVGELVEAIARGTLFSTQGFTSVVVSGIEFPQINVQGAAPLPTKRRRA